MTGHGRCPTDDRRSGSDHARRTSPSRPTSPVKGSKGSALGGDPRGRAPWWGPGAKPLALLPSPNCPAPARSLRRRVLCRPGGADPAPSHSTGERTHGHRSDRLRHPYSTGAPHQQVAQVPRRRAAGLGRRHGFRRRATDHRRTEAPDRQPGIRLRRARGRAGRCLRPPHGAPLRLAGRSRRHRRPIGDLVQASFSSVMAFSEPGDAILLQLPSYPPFMARDQRHRPPPDRQPDARQRHALGAGPRRLRRRARSARPRADLLPPAEPHRPRLQPGGTGGRWRPSPSATT